MNVDSLQMRRGPWTALLMLALLSVGCGGGGGSEDPGDGDDPAPTLSTITPDTAYPTGSITVTLTGAGFQENEPGATTVRVGGGVADEVVVVSDTALTCRVPAGSVGPADVVLTNANGTARLTAGFSYRADPPTFLPSEQRLNGSDPGSEQAEHATICCAGRYVYAAWQDRRNGEFDVYFSRSADHGRTWETPDRRLDTDPPGAAASEDVRMCCDGSTVYVLWHDQRNGTSDLYLNRSLDHGATWLAEDRLVNDSAGTSFKSSSDLCCDGESVYVVWDDDRNGEADIYFNRSTDGGLSWRGVDMRIGSDALGSARSRYARIHCSDGQLSVVWSDARDAPGAASIYFNRSTDGGATWLRGDVRVDHDVLDAGDAGVPQISCAGTDVFVVWSDDRSGEDDIFANLSSDRGDTWRPIDMRLDTDQAGSARSRFPRLCRTGPTVGVVWVDRRDGTDAVYFNRSTNAGSTWLLEDRRINQVIPGSDVGRAGICGDGPYLFAVWSESRASGETDIYLNRSLDAGGAWLAEDIRLDTEAPGTSPSSAPEICCEGARLHVVWHDRRNGGSSDVYTRSTGP